MVSSREVGTPEYMLPHITSARMTRKYHKLYISGLNVLNILRFETKGKKRLCYMFKHAMYGKINCAFIYFLMCTSIFKGEITVCLYLKGELHCF